MTDNKVILRGEVYYCELPKNEGSRMQGGIRPCVIISNDKANKFSPIIKVIPLTSNLKRTELFCHAVIKADSQNGLTVDSMVLGEQTLSIDRDKVLGRIGILNKEDQARVYSTDLFQSGLINYNDRYAIELLKKTFSLINSGKANLGIELLQTI